MALVAFILCLMTTFHLITPCSLLSITFLLGVGIALNVPAMQTAIATMVPTEDLQEASTLNSIGFNTARLLGPALGGCLIALYGPSLVFMIDTLSFLGVIFFFLWLYHHPQHPCSSKLHFKESFLGFSTIIVHQRFKNILKRTTVFFFCSSIIWALWPIIAKIKLGEGIAPYTHFVMCLGMGAVIGGLSLAWLRSRLSSEKVVFYSCLLLSLSLGIIPLTKNHLLIYGALILIGFTWIASSSTFNVAVLKIFPEQLRSRAFSLYWIFFTGSFALGSAMWGKLASLSTVHRALLVSSALAFLSALLSLRWKMEEVAEE